MESLLRRTWDPEPPKKDLLAKAFQFRDGGCSRARPPGCGDAATPITTSVIDIGAQAFANPVEPKKTPAMREGRPSSPSPAPRSARPYRGAFNNTNGATPWRPCDRRGGQAARAIDPASIDDVVMGCALEQGHHRAQHRPPVGSACRPAEKPSPAWPWTVSAPRGLMAIATAAPKYNHQRWRPSGRRRRPGVNLPGAETPR